MNTKKFTIHKIAEPRKQSVAVWELTLACNLKCRHCGSSAGKRRKEELTTDQALDIVKKLKDIGIKEINLIGGEATLREDWQVIGKAITQADMVLGFQTGGLHITNEIIKKMVDIGTTALGVSIDGVGAVHDNQRGVLGSYQKALQTLDDASTSKIPFITCTTQLNRLSFRSLFTLLERVARTRVSSWQLGPTLPMGVGTSAKDLHFRPSDFFVIHELAAIFSIEAWKRGILGIAGNPLGYFGPYERLIRSGPHNLNNYYRGCPAGNGVIGIESNGTIKGCPSLPTKQFSLGKALENGFQNLERIDNHKTSAYKKTIKGFCKTCPFSTTCWSGCGWSTTSTMGSKGDNPYCMFRSIINMGRNIYEDLEQLNKGKLGPFELGTYSLRERKGRDPAMIDINTVEKPRSMENTFHSFSNYRNKVIENSQKIYQSHSNQEFSTKEVPFSILEEMETNCLPINYLEKSAQNQKKLSHKR